MSKAHQSGPGSRVVSHTDVRGVPRGGTLTVGPDALVTPLALEVARERGVTIARSDSAGTPPPSVVRQVTRQVVARLGDASPEVLEAVIAEVVTALGAQEGGGGVEVTPSIDYCQMCLEQDRARSRTRAVLTTTGRNQKGIVARVTSKIAEMSGDILDIAQTIVGDYFTMIIVVDVGTLNVPFATFKDALEAEAKAIGLSCMMMHEDVVSSLHRI